MPDGKDPGSKAPGDAKRDVLLMYGRTDDGEGIQVLRRRDARLEAGELRALKEGVPISGEVVTLSQRKDQPALWDVEVQCDRPSASAHAGPARIASRAYRENWDEIFGDVGGLDEDTEHVEDAEHAEDERLLN